MKKHYLLLSIGAIVIIMGGIFLVSLYNKTDSDVLIGYVQDFRDPASMDYSKLSHVIFSFTHPEEDGSLTMNGEDSLSNLRKTVKLAHQEDTKVMLAVGGRDHVNGGESYDYFKAAISDLTSRGKLVDELTEITEKENLDGIDIDFEHPRSVEDAQYLADFTEALGDKLHSHNKELSIAVSSKVHSETGEEVPSVVYDPAMFEDVDYINIMAYDGHWDGGYNAANFSPYSFTENVVRYWSQLFDQHGISKEKLVLGVPFYAQPEEKKSEQVSYETIINQDPEHAERDRANVNGMTYHYNGETTIKQKTELAHANGFGGMMIWEMGHDVEGERSLTQTIFKTQKRVEEP